MNEYEKYLKKINSSNKMRGGSNIVGEGNAMDRWYTMDKDVHGAVDGDGDDVDDDNDEEDDLVKQEDVELEVMNSSRRKSNTKKPITTSTTESNAANITMSKKRKSSTTISSLETEELEIGSGVNTPRKRKNPRN